MKSKHLYRFGAAALVALASMAMMATLAQGATPAPGYERFAGCPSPAENSTIAACTRVVIKGGHFQMGSKDVPISKPMTMTGGFNADLKGFAANSAGGLTPVKQTVPGGVIGITGLDWLVNFLNAEGLKLYAVTELVGEPTNLSFTSVTLPIKVHLVNPVLGNNCYIGSASKPTVDGSPALT